MANSGSGASGHVESLAIDGFSPEDFASFFRDVHGYEPFPWQKRLTAQVLDQGEWPKVIDLPTGTGKTSVLDTALFVMAAKPQTSPRRVVFVIDRRIVVDQVHERALKIQGCLNEPKTPVLERMRDRLGELSGGEPLGVAALRGGIPIDSEWTHRPDQPWVIVSTVDQFGSRLLFRGYGITWRMRPIHAGLAGNDCLVILDEMHLSVPFAQTVAKVSSLRSRLLPCRFSTVEMSATPTDKDAERFNLDRETDLESCAELRRRVEAKKRAKLVPIANPQAVPGAVLKIIRSVDKSRRNDQDNVHSIGVVVNRVRTARETHEKLKTAGYDTHLITGRMRPLDRIEALERIGPIVDPERDDGSDRFSVVVATQAIEVGADFSFDALVTECASVDSLRQRFGRLDRRGTHSKRAGGPAQAWILGPKSVVASKKPDPIYGGSVKVTWDELKGRLENGTVDVGPTALRDFPDDATAPKANAPLLMRTHMDAWVQTRPEPIVQPSIDWFLHGIEKNDPADVSIIWRWDQSIEVLRLVPPRQAEFLQVPIAAAKSWLSGAEEVDVSDVSFVADSGENQSGSTRNTNDWVRWTGFQGKPEKIQVKDIRPGDVLVVSPTRGGLTDGTWNPSSEEEVPDLGDAAQIEYVAYGRRATLRLDKRLKYGDSPPPEPSQEIESGSAVHGRIGEWLKGQLIEPALGSHWMRYALERLDMNKNPDLIQLGVDAENTDETYYVLVECHEDTRKPIVDASVMDGSDASGSLTGTGVTLDRHLESVGERAARIAARLQLPPAIIADLRLAGRLHDLGKVDSRFQTQLVGGDRVDLEMTRETPLAKSLPGVRRISSRISRYPKGTRHEVASVAMIESNDKVLGSAHDRDLVLHLIGSHHGWGRPFLPIIEDPSPETLRYTFEGHSMETSSGLLESSLALDMADRFWRLVERYGYHGLAWLEAILRLADHQQSASEGKTA